MSYHKKIALQQFHAINFGIIPSLYLVIFLALSNKGYVLSKPFGLTFFNHEYNSPKAAFLFAGNREIVSLLAAGRSPGFAPEHPAFKQKRGFNDRHNCKGGGNAPHSCAKGSGSRAKPCNGIALHSARKKLLLFFGGH